jgi:predicted Zn-dependent protease with MMP-like domain
MTFEGNLDAPYSHLLGIAEKELLAILSSLPPEIRTPVSSLPLIFEEFPSEEAIADGISPDQLGVFEGSPALESDAPQPARIIIWLGNIWDMCEACESGYREEVRVTILHEFGHFLGWDEEDLFDRGLE